MDLGLVLLLFLTPPLNSLMSTSPNSNQPAFEFASSSLAETARFSAALADSVTPGLVIGLIGNLGAGKTTLVRALAEALEVDPRAVNSPTYVLVHEYSGRIPLFHFDTYRLTDPEQFANLGADEYFEAGGVCLVEWADRVAEYLPSDRLDIRLAATSDTERAIAVHATGPVARQVVSRLITRLGRDRRPENPLA